MRNSIIFYLNGQRQEVTGPWVLKPFAEYLRYQKSLTGTKIVCAEGDCGACTVLRASFQSVEKPKFEAINSCISLVAQMDGCHVVTVEGLAQEDQLSPAQESFIACHSSQCGYCTPGFVMALEGLLEKQKPYDEKAVKNHFTGNLCRCTGYQSILQAGLQAQTFPRKTLSSRYFSASSVKELKRLSQIPVSIEWESQSYSAPTTLKQLAQLQKKNPRRLILGSGTDLGVQINKGHRELEHVLSLQLIPDLKTLSRKGKTLRIGAQVTLTQLRRALEKHQLHSLLDLFASPQIKNLATLAGNIANASPIADTPPFLLALGAEVEILTKKGLKTWPLSDFFIGYRKTKLSPGDVILAITFKIPGKNERLQFFKSSQRKDLDISCVSSCLWIQLDSRNDIQDCRLAYGGVGPTPLRMKNTESLLRGQSLSQLDFAKVNQTLQKEISPRSDLRGSEAYRRLLVENLFRKMVHDLL